MADQGPPKRSRPDVTSRRAANKQFDTVVIKTTANSFFKPFALWLLDLEDFLFDANKAVYEAYLLANFHVTRLMQEDKSPALGPLQDFYYNCLKLVTQSSRNKPKCKDSELAASAKTYVASRAADYRPASSDYISAGCFNNLSLRMATETQTSAEQAVLRRFHRFVCSKFATWVKNAKQGWGVVNRSLAPEVEGQDFPVQACRGILDRFLQDRPADGSLKLPAQQLLPLQHFMLQHFEEQQANGSTQKRDRLYTLLPTKAGYGCSYQKVCTTTLYGIIKRSEDVFTELRIPVPSNLTKFKDNGLGWWRWLTNVDDFCKRGLSFAGEVQTDGKAVSITMRKPKQQASPSAAYAPPQPPPHPQPGSALPTHPQPGPAPHHQSSSAPHPQPRPASQTHPQPSPAPHPQPRAPPPKPGFKPLSSLNAADYDRVIGMDLGRREIFVGSIVTKYPGKEALASTVIRCSSKHFRAQTGLRTFQRQHKEWTGDNPDYQDIMRGLNDLSMKTADQNKVLKLAGYITSRASMGCRLDFLLKFHMDKPYRRAKLTRFIMRQKMLHNLCNMVTRATPNRHIDPRRTLVGVGNWAKHCADPAGFFKNCPAGPVKPFLRLLSHQCSLAIIDEHNTSKLCAECHTVLNAMDGVIKRQRKGAPRQSLADSEMHAEPDGGRVVRGKVYSVRLCPNKVCSARVNRDVNASRNILALLQASMHKQPRPAPFCRGHPP